MNKISIYQVLPRLFGNTNARVKHNGGLAENGTGKMHDFTQKALKAIKELGFTHIWYTGIIEHATCEKYPQYNIHGQHPQVVKGKAGSPYAITDYFDVNPYLAKQIPERMAEFEALVERTHKSGLKVIIDFVPNHVARQYHSDVRPDLDFGLNDDISKAFLSTNDFYYLPDEPLHLAADLGTPTESRDHQAYVEFPAKATGNDQFHAWPSANDWYETVKLNYGVDYLNGQQTHFTPPPPLWDKMVNILLYWCKKNIDGIRCDMAEMVPVEFWNYAISRVKKEYPSVLFIAEVYNPSEYRNYLLTGGFDYLYDKVGLYDCLREIICYDRPAHDITTCWKQLEGINHRMLRFLENHDEQRIASGFFAGNPFHAMPAMTVCATMDTGPVMIYFGQETGEPADGTSGYSGDDGRTTIFDFFNIPEFLKWMNKGKFDGNKLSAEQKTLLEMYRKLLLFSISNQAVAQGNFYDLVWANRFEGGMDTRYVYAYLRYASNERLLIVVNFHKYKSQQFRLKIPEHALTEMQLPLAGKIGLKDVLSDTRIEGTSLTQLALEGIYIELQPLNSYIYKLG